MKHDLKALHTLWTTFNISKKEFAEQRGLPYQTLITSFRRIEREEEQSSSKDLDLKSFSKVEICDPASIKNEHPRIIIVTSSGTRLEVPV